MEIIIILTEISINNKTDINIDNSLLFVSALHYTNLKSNLKFRKQTKDQYYIG